MARPAERTAPGVLRLGMARRGAVSALIGTRRGRLTIYARVNDTVVVVHLDFNLIPHWENVAQNCSNRISIWLNMKVESHWSKSANRVAG